MSGAPYIYSRFGKTKPDGSTVKLRIQDMRPCDVNVVIEFMGKWFAHEETFSRAAGVSKSEEALAEMRGFNEGLLKEEDSHCLICCIDHEDDEKLEIVAANTFYLDTKEDFTLEMKTDSVKKMFRIIDELSKVYNVLEELQVESCLGGAGLSVDPSYRRCGIATMLLLARRPMLRRRGLPLTYAWFTSAASQKAAFNAGYEKVAELTFQELGRRADVTFTGVPDTVKLMILREY